MGKDSIFRFLTPGNVDLIKSIMSDVKRSPALIGLMAKFKFGSTEDEVYDILVSLSDQELVELSRVIARALMRAKRKSAG